MAITCDVKGCYYCEIVRLEGRFGINENRFRESLEASPLNELSPMILKFRLRFLIPHKICRFIGIFGGLISFLSASSHC